MAQKTFLTVVLRKEVATAAAAQAAYNFVKQKLIDVEEVTISGTINTRTEDEPES